MENWESNLVIFKRCSLGGWRPLATPVERMVGGTCQRSSGHEHVAVLSIIEPPLLAEPLAHT